MFRWQWWLALASCAAVLLFSNAGEAKTSLLILGDGVIVYSGPATYYRPLAVLPARTELRASAKTVKGRGGEYYKVVVKVGEKQSAIGFIPTSADARLNEESLDEDDFEKFGEVALVSKALQLTVAPLKDKNNAWTLGYMHYLSPGFYVKGFGGKFSSPSSGGLIAGGEVGNDALLFRSVSGYVSFGMGIFSPSADGDVFAGSNKLNMMAQAAVGARYNISGIASFSAGGTQMALFNANNSSVAAGAIFTLEVGL